MASPSGPTDLVSFKQEPPSPVAAVKSGVSFSLRNWFSSVTSTPPPPAESPAVETSAVKTPLASRRGSLLIATQAAAASPPASPMDDGISRSGSGRLEAPAASPVDGDSSAALLDLPPRRLTLDEYVLFWFLFAY